MLPQVKSLNPFSVYQHRAEGENFIGRGIELQDLVNFLESSSVCIIGLPRIGKSSILNYLLQSDKDYWFNMNTIPLVLNAGEKSKSYDLWKSIIKEVKTKLDEFLEVKAKLEYKDILEKYFNDAIEDDYLVDLRDDFYKFVRKANEYLGIKFIIGLDEFHNVGNNGYFTREDFNFIRTLSDNKYTLFAVASRKSFPVIEKSIHESPYFFNDFKEIVLSVFNQEDVEAYWKKWLPVYTSLVTEENLPRIREIVTYFAGRHPNILSLANYNLWKAIKENSIDYRNRLNEESLLRFLSSNAQRELNWIIDLLKEEKLLEPAIQLVKGPDYGVSVDDRNRLIDLGFLMEIPIKEKDSLFGQRVGPTYIMEKQHNMPDPEPYGYVCFSNYFNSLFFYQLNAKKPDTIRLDTEAGLIANYQITWFELENKLRKLIASYISYKYGENCFDLDPTKTDGTEMWESAFLKDLSKSNGEKKVSKFNGYINTKNGPKERYLKKGIKLVEDSDRYLNSWISAIDTGTIWNCFMNNDWETFGVIFKSMKYTKNQFYKNVYEPINNKRNEMEHTQISALNETELKRIDDLHKVLIKQIDNFFYLNHGKFI